MAVPPASPTKGSRKTEKRGNTKEMDSHPAKRSKNPGVRVQGGRIYDSENGKTCHQCRQKTMDFTASCRAMKGDKPCTINFCHKCLLNRYGEKAEHVSTLDDWKCPKCRGDCNCSFCMKKKGQTPTGILTHTAKLTGFSSVHELLNRGAENDATSSPNKTHAAKMELVASKDCINKENCDSQKNDTVRSDKKCAKPKKVLAEKKTVKPIKRLKQMNINIECVKNVVNNDNKPQIMNIENELSPDAGNKEILNHITKEDIAAEPPKIDTQLRKNVTMPARPPGKSLTNVAGVDLPAEDVGPALQFLEFCTVFAKVLDIKKREPEAIIRELVRGLSHRRCRVNSAIIHFQIRLLTLILEDIGEEPYLENKSDNAWLKALDKCLGEYKHLASWLPFDFTDNFSRYNDLDSSKKLRILVFLCDEALCTNALRTFLDEDNAKFAFENKERREQISAAKAKEKHIKQELKNNLAKAMLPTEEAVQLSISEHDEFILKIKHETDKAHQEMLGSIDLLPKKKEAPEAVRTCPLFIEKDGIVFWRLKSHNKSSSIILQDIEKLSVILPQDKWFIFDDEEQQMVDKYISSVRSEKEREQRQFLKNAFSL